MCKKPQEPTSFGDLVEKDRYEIAQFCTRYFNKTAEHRIPEERRFYLAQPLVLFEFLLRQGASKDYSEKIVFEKLRNPDLSLEPPSIQFFEKINSYNFKEVKKLAQALGISIGRQKRRDLTSKILEKPYEAVATTISNLEPDEGEKPQQAAVSDPISPVVSPPDEEAPQAGEAKPIFVPTAIVPFARVVPQELDGHFSELQSDLAELSEKFYYGFREQDATWLQWVYEDGRGFFRKVDERVVVSALWDKISNIYPKLHYARAKMGSSMNIVQIAESSEKVAKTYLTHIRRLSCPALPLPRGVSAWKDRLFDYSTLTSLPKTSTSTYFWYDCIPFDFLPAFPPEELLSYWSKMCNGSLELFCRLRFLFRTALSGVNTDNSIFLVRGASPGPGKIVLDALAQLCCNHLSDLTTLSFNPKERASAFSEPVLLLRGLTTLSNQGAEFLSEYLTKGSGEHVVVIQTTVDVPQLLKEVPSFTKSQICLLDFENRAFSSQDPKSFNSFYYPTIACWAITMPIKPADQLFSPLELRPVVCETLELLQDHMIYCPSIGLEESLTVERAHGAYRYSVQSAGLEKSEPRKVFLEKLLEYAKNILGLTLEPKKASQLRGKRVLPGIRFKHRLAGELSNKTESEWGLVDYSVTDEPAELPGDAINFEQNSLKADLLIATEMNLSQELEASLSPAVDQWRSSVKAFFN